MLTGGKGYHGVYSYDGRTQLNQEEKPQEKPSAAPKTELSGYHQSVPAPAYGQYGSSGYGKGMILYIGNFNMLVKYFKKQWYLQSLLGCLDEKLIVFLHRVICYLLKIRAAHLLFYPWALPGSIKVGSCPTQSVGRLHRCFRKKGVKIAMLYHSWFHRRGFLVEGHLNST